jgi:hypothetical protein
MTSDNPPLIDFPLPLDPWSAPEWKVRTMAPFEVVSLSAGTDLEARDRVSAVQAKMSLQYPNRLDLDTSDTAMRPARSDHQFLETTRHTLESITISAPIRSLRIGTSPRLVNLSVYNLKHVDLEFFLHHPQLERLVISDSLPSPSSLGSLRQQMVQGTRSSFTCSRLPKVDFTGSLQDSHSKRSRRRSDANVSLFSSSA